MSEYVIPISLWLQPSKQTNILWCMICRGGMRMKVEGYPRQIIFGDASVSEGEYRPLKFPIKYRCTTENKYGRCPALWIIQGFIEDGK